MKLCSFLLITFFGFFSVLLSAMEQPAYDESSLFELEIEVARAQLACDQQKRVADEAERYYQRLKQILKQAQARSKQ